MCLRRAVSAIPFFVFISGDAINYIAWNKHQIGLQISLKRYALSMEDKMAAAAFRRATSYGWDSPFNISQENFFLNKTLIFQKNET